MNKNILFVAFALMFILPMVSATYLPQKYNTNFDLVISSNNATACNLTYIQYPDGSKVNYNIALAKNGQDFSTILNKGNYTMLGSVCHGLTCNDALGNIQTGSICREVTPSGDKGVLGLSIILILAIYGIAFFGFFGKNIWIAVIGGMAMMSLGIYMLTNGIDVYRNFMTQSFSAITIAIGAIFALTAGVELIEEYK